jgi:hypothetical protein
LGVGGTLVNDRHKKYRLLSDLEILDSNIRNAQARFNSPAHYIQLALHEFALLQIDDCLEGSNAKQQECQNAIGQEGNPGREVLHFAVSQSDEGQRGSTGRQKQTKEPDPLWYLYPLWLFGFIPLYVIGLWRVLMSYFEHDNTDTR